MNRIDSILETPLMSNERYRKGLIEFIEKKISSNLNHQYQLTNIPFHFFQNSTELRTILKEAFEDSINYINFTHTSKDYILQKLIFIFLIYSVSKYPDEESWSKFMNVSSNEQKAIEISEGISHYWSKIQNHIITNWIENDFDSKSKE